MPNETHDRNHKAMTLEERMSAVHDAVFALGNEARADETWPVAIFDDTVIVRQGDAFYRAGYTADEDGVQIDDPDTWVQVQHEWAEVKRAFLDGLHGAPQPQRGNAIKALGGGRVGGYGVLWGDASRKDLAGEYFTPDTEDLDAIFKAMGKVPGLYQHAMDQTLKSTVTGVIDVMVADDKGLWVEEQLDMANEYAERILQLVDAGKLFWSSGTLPGARKVARDGHIQRWPVVEFSKTPTPAEFRMLERPLEQVKAHYGAIGLEFTETDGSGKDSGIGAEDARQQLIAARLGMVDVLELETQLA